MRYKILNYKPEISHYYTADGVSYEKGKKIPRIINSLINWFIKKKWLIQHYIRNDEVTYKQITIDMENLYDTFKEQLYYYEMINDPVKMIVVGHDFYEKICENNELKNTGMLNIQFGEEGVQYHLAGIKLVLDPFITGIVFLTEGSFKY